MLSTNSTSSVQKRRQLHRRQQSLEVPLLATPLPANPRRNTKPAAHRRGLSLDQSLSNLNSPAAFRHLLPQDQDHTPDQESDTFHGTPPVRIHLDTTNIGHPQGQQHPQHFLQEPQSHRPAQPGFPVQDFQSHLQQQLKGNINTPTIVAPIPTPHHQVQALQDLQQHLEWYQQNFGQTPSPNPVMQANIAHQQIMTEMPINPTDTQVQPQQYMVGAMPHTPISNGHSHTVPNTPQQFVRSWPSPPATQVKHIRSQSFQFDVAPMPTFINDNGAHSLEANSPYVNPQDAYTHDFGYASSAYSSSNVDPMSPGRQFNCASMPTLYEEPTINVGGHSHHDGLEEDDILLQAAAGACDDFNSPNFIVGGGGIGMSPNTAMLHNMGEDVNATLIDTGIASEEVEMNISEQNEKTKWWYCLYELNNGKKCNKAFKRKENARSHVQNHLGDRQFQCNDCGKTFVRQHDMKRHAAIHKDARPHICPCGSKFARHDALTRHRQRGMCKGTLPGFERAEEDKPKRGRPKKERPDQVTRSAKANKARQMDRENEGSGEINFASPNSSGMSDHSLPMTPPDTSDFDADAFINLANVDTDYDEMQMDQYRPYQWHDTPPTSPASAHTQAVKTISPAMLNNSNNNNQGSFTGGSSPVSHHHGQHHHQSLDLGPVNSQPEIPFASVMSPEDYGSTNASSPFTSDEPVELRHVSLGSLHLEDDEPLFGGSKEPEVAFALGPMLNQWLAMH